MSDTKVIFIRYFSVLISAITTLLALKVFLAFEKNDAATLLALLGWLLFMPLMQFGYGRTSYAHIRKMRANGLNIYKAVLKFLNVASLQSLASCLLMSSLAYFLCIQNNYSDSKLELVFFAFGLTTFQISILKRDLAYSLDLEVSYEVIEALRRTLLLSAYIALFFDIALFKVSIFGIIVGIGTFIYMRYIILACLKNEKEEIINEKNASHFLKKDFKSNALKLWGFTASELAFYNIPLIFFTFYPSPIGIAYYAVWSRLWITLNMPYRIFVDTKINLIITSFLNKNNLVVIKNLILCLIASCSMMIACFSLLNFFSSSIFELLGANSIVDSYLILSLGIWISGNIIQHTFGSFILSYGNGFSFSFFISLFSLSIIFLTFTISYVYYESVGFSLMLCGIVYLAISLSYLIKSVSVIRNNV